MAHSTLWPKKTFFYPVGNTSPCCFTQELAPELDATILLLACGDPRSILYTAELASDKRTLDFTCCDWEPAIIARNILLFGMIIDGIQPIIAWSIFYHLFLGPKENEVLVAQCCRLASSSASMDDWKTSKYGHILRFCTEHSLAETRRHWILYRETSELSGKARETLKDQYLSGMATVLERVGRNPGFGLATGPLVFNYMLDGTRERVQSHTEYWTTGVTSSQLFKAAVRNYVNPTFVHSLMGTEFNVHYGTDPIKAFFLAPTLAPLDDRRMPLAVELSDCVKQCIYQFSTWYLSFSRRLASSSGTVVVRFALSEALSFCRALMLRQDGQNTDSGAYSYIWGGTQINFSPESSDRGSSIPTCFDIIDTSNLADHCGLLNLLAVAIPLLRQSPSSVLHTNTLLPSQWNGVSTNGLSEKVRADLPTLSLLLGIVPVSYTSHFTTVSDKHHILSTTVDSGQIGELISWKFVSSSLPGRSTQDRPISPSILICDSKVLASFLRSLYHRMFLDNEHDRPSFLLSPTNLGKKIPPYQPASFVYILQQLRTRIHVDWDETIRAFVGRTVLDSFGRFSRLQELICQLQLRGFVSLKDKPSLCAQDSNIRGLPFVGWKSIPSVVCVVLKIPRPALKVLEEEDVNVIGTPVLQCEVNGPTSSNVHLDIRPIFGDVNISYSKDGEIQVEIIEDASGFNGDSPLIVSFYTMSANLQVNEPIRIGLHLQETPTTQRLRSKLGGGLAIFSALSTDVDHIQVVHHRPDNPREFILLKASTLKPSKEYATFERTAMNFDSSSSRVSSLTIRDCITDVLEAESLAKGRIFIFPYPVRGSLCITRVARKSSYIELECPLRRTFDDTLDLSLDPFPIGRVQHLYNPVNVHYVQLDKLPFLCRPLPKDQLKWLDCHLGTTLSSMERVLHRNADTETKGPFLNLKESLAHILSKCLAPCATGGRYEIISLFNPRGIVGVYTLIFVNDIKLDLAGHTVLVDACVLPLTKSLCDRIVPVLQRVANLQARVLHVVTRDDEVRLWRQMLPVIAERCRTWMHAAHCEYLVRGIPVVVDGLEESPLCSCGKGKDLGAFGDDQQWKLIHKEATRIAISPLFPFTSLENMMSSITSDVTEGQGVLPHVSSSSNATQSCANCSGPGKPALKVCSLCQKTNYCSRECQKGHWKAHKVQCRLSTT